MTRKLFTSTMTASLAGLAAAASACGGRQSVVESAGVQANRLEGLWWIFFWVTGVVYVIVMAMLVTAFFRRQKGDENSPPNQTKKGSRDLKAENVIKGAVALTVVTLFVLMFFSFRAGRAIDSLSHETPELVIKITGHQWWWEVEYYDEGMPSNNVKTANEIHVPVGRKIKLLLESGDVIHSIWMPNFHGKKDLVPIYPTQFYFQADTPGTFWGQCAEFCGYQHAKMRFAVIAEDQAAFDKWMSDGRTIPPPPPAGTVEARGQEIFKTSVCAQCHTIAGTDTSGRVGPDLSHIGSRPYIAAASMDNTPENLAKWITDPQAFKPGIRMPMNQFSDGDLNALVTYLRSLK